MTRGPESAASLLPALAAEAAEVVLLEAGRDGRLAAASPGASRLLGRDPSEAGGLPLEGVFAEADAGRLRGLLGGPPGRHGPWLLNVVGVGGAVVTVRALVEAGDGALAVAGIRAVEEEGRAGEALLLLNSELAAATRESARRGRELEKALSELGRAQARLVHQEKTASLGVTTAGVAHEINTPLGVALANTETLRRDLGKLFDFVNAVGDRLGDLRAAAPDAAFAIEEAARRAGLVELAESIPARLASNREGLERIGRVVADLRAFSRLDEAARKEADLVEGVAATLRFLGPLLRERQVALETDFPDELRLVCAPGALNQAVAGLVTNAAQACQPGQSVRVSLGREGPTVRIGVEDDGCGIAAADLPRVFDPFFTTKPVGEGVGLGLCMVHQVVESHRGRIEIESSPGLGTRVTVRIPAARGGAV